MASVLRDFRYSVRALRKTPAVAAVSILALTLGIGLTTTMFSIVYGALIRGLPFDEPASIMSLERNNPSRNIDGMGVSIHDFADWRASQRTFEDIAAYYTGTVNISGTEGAERFDGAFLSANAFRLLRARPLMGRTFRDGEDTPSGERVLLIGYAMWKSRFDSDPRVLGQTVRANGEPYTIVGVMPERFAFPENTEVWLPLRMDPLALKRGDGQGLNAFGRLKGGVSLDRASLELSGIARRLSKEYSKTNEGVGVVIRPFTEAFIGREPTAMLYTMLGAVGFVLLIACTNVANLLLGRAAHRSREVGIRTALGASRFQVVRQFLMESLVLSATGALLGLAVAEAGVRLFNRAIVSTQPPFWIDIKIDLPVLGFVLAVTLASSLASGLIPAIQASRADINAILKDESRGASSFRIGRLSRGLVMFEIALSCGLLVGAGLMVKSVAKLRLVDFGFPTTDLFTARVGLPETTYRDGGSQTRFFEQLEARLASVPGIKNVALTSNLPGLGSDPSDFAREGVAYASDRDYPRARRVVVSPGFLPMIGAVHREGRGLGAQDRAGSVPVAVVNASFARAFFKGESAVGRRIRLGGRESTDPWLTIVGVVPDRFAGGPDNKEPQAIYLPLAQNPMRFVSIAAQAAGNPTALTPLVRSAVISLDPDLPIYRARTLDEAVAQETWFYRVFGSLFIVFGAAAFLLAAIGLYAVMSFSVGQRLREMGVRMALGAQSRDVVALVLRQGAVQIGVGVAVGLAFAAFVSKLLGILLFNVNPRDPAIFASVVLVLGLAGALASYVPARRATRVDPMLALRSE
ncbi:MAG: ABC transporter permease [Gemmatimonadaceae bacterium]